jgi:hypothetical protein
MLMNTKPKINQKILLSPPPAGPPNWCHLQHVKTLMGLSRRRLSKSDVLGLIDTREIRWAWDIARRNARRPEVRIWRESLVAYLSRENAGEAAPLADDLSLSQVIEAILPRPPVLSMRTGTVRGSDLQKRFLCCQTHITHLVADGELCSVSPPRPRETPSILYQSVFEFLQRRSLSVSTIKKCAGTCRPMT